MIKYYLFLLGALLFWSACSEPKDADRITRIEYGTSFGECLGYCIHTLTLEENLATFSTYSWDPDIERKDCSEALSEESWSDWRVRIDAAAFFSMEKTIGCPDCADGGAEWVEIEMGDGRKHKVTFEYRNEPEALSTVVSGLRDQMGLNEACGMF